LVVLSIATILLACGCVGNSLNSNPPEHIKAISAIKQADGYQVYFILADQSGQETTSDGSYKMVIGDDKGSWVSRSKNVTKAEFQSVKIGMGAFEHDGIIYNVGIINNTVLDSAGLRGSGAGKVTVHFTTPVNRTLEGEETIFL
jgi:hypothetical protein